MSTAAILMMLVAMAVIWGGLILAVINLSRSRDVPSREEIRRDL